jgi:hypothetical protein
MSEKLLESVKRTNEQLSYKSLTESQVVDLINLPGKPIPAEHRDSYIKIANLQEKMLKESNVSGDIAIFTKKLQPLLRRIYPGLALPDLVGIQPVDGPSSAVYGIKAKYAGSQIAPIDSDGQLLELVEDLAVPTAVGGQISSAGGAVGTIAYKDTVAKKVASGAVQNTVYLVVNVTAGRFVNGELYNTGATYSATGAKGINAVFSTESAYKQILPNYSGPYSTAVGEALGEEMNQIKVTVEKLPVEVKTRKLKAQFTVELVQDLQAMHGARAEEELLKFLEIEIQLDLDQEVLAAYRKIALASPDFVVSDRANVSQGRWSLEQYAGLYQRIIKENANIAVRNRRGKGNRIVTTAGVISALYALGKFKILANETDIENKENQSQLYVGTLADGTRVYQDWFASNEYVLQIYRGGDNFSAGLIYAPYQPLQFLSATDPLTLQPVIGLITRYGLVVNSLLDDDGAGSSFASIYRVDFSNTPLQY